MHKENTLIRKFPDEELLWPVKTVHFDPLKTNIMTIDYATMVFGYASLSMAAKTALRSLILILILLPNSAKREEDRMSSTLLSFQGSTPSRETPSPSI